MKLALAVLPLLGFLCARPCAQGLFFVDDDAPGVFATIQEAVDAAPAGSTIFVRPGAYVGDVQLGKSMHVVGLSTDGQLPRIHGVVTVAGIPVGGEVVLRGLELRGSVAAHALFVTGCAGSVLIEDLEVKRAIRAEGSGRVLIARSAVSSAIVYAAPALTALGSSIHAFDSSFDGFDAPSVFLPGMAAIAIDTSFLSLSGCALRGGDGDYYGACTPSLDAGPGLSLTASSCLRLDTVIEGGKGEFFEGCQGDDGQAIVGSGVVDVPGSAHSMQSSGPVREGDPLELDVQGIAGELALALVANDFDPVYAPLLSGTLAVSPSAIAVPLGTIPTGGALHVALPFTLAPGLQEVRLAAQIAHLDPSGLGAHFVGGPSALLLLDHGVPLTDCDGNGIDDSIDALAGTHPDCDGDGLFDFCALYTGASQDCNGNGVPDGCDIAAGTSLDVDGNGVPDECAKTLHVPSAYPTLAAAVAAAHSGDEIVLADGVYQGAENKHLFLTDLSISIRSENGPTTCIVDGQGDGSFLDALGHDFDLSLSGIAFRKFDGSVLESSGHRSLLVERCSFTTIEAQAVYLGAVSAFPSQSAVFRDCSFVDCKTALHLRTQDALVERCSFQNLDGGVFFPAAIYALGATTVRDCFFAACHGSQGGAIRFSTTNPGTISGCTFRNCFAEEEGGAIYTSSGPVTIENSIFWDNFAANSGDNVYCGSSAAPHVISHSDLEGGMSSVGGATSLLTFGPGNLATDPLFANPTNPYNFHLQPTSPCRDAGDPGYVPVPGELDLDGQPRVGGAAIDMGADELHP